MLKYLKKYWFFALLAPVFMIGEVSMDLLQPELMSRIIDDGVLGLNNGGVGNLNTVITIGLITGTDLADKLKHHLDVMGVEITEKQVTTVYAMGSYFGIQTPDIMYEASSVILAGGVVMGKLFPGEDELLGRGVSYCATCDAHFYKGKAVAVLGYNAESCREADFLAETCARVLYFPVVPHEVNVGPNVTVVRERVLSIPGTMRAEGVQTDKDLHPVDGVFVLRDAVAPDKLVPGLATDGPHVAVDAQMRTNLPGCFACGDLAGKPYQYIKAAGQGNIAALSAVEWLAEQK